MSAHQIIEKYFQSLSSEQIERYKMLGEMYQEWNSKVNLISRQDIAHLYERHILHSLAIAKFIRFKKDSHIMDLGTGGGFPGIPLAIYFPEVQFTLVDSIAKKIRVVSDIAGRLELENVTAVCSRAEEVKEHFDYVVSRATAPLNDLYKWSRKSISSHQKNAIPNGIICLKGGDLEFELKPFKGRIEVVEISQYFEGLFFETKKLVFLAI